MDPRARKVYLLFGLGVFFGGALAVVVWNRFVHLGGWAIAGILLGIWIAMGVVSVILLRRQNRRR
jgi:hypothetical protein